MGKILKFRGHALTSVGQRSGRSSDRDTPVASSILGANSAGTPRLERLSQYQTWDCVVPIRSAKGFCPPAASHARCRASVDMDAPYPDLGKNQPRTLWGTDYPDFGTFQPMAGVDKMAVGKRIRDRRMSLGLSQTALALAAGMKQQGVQNIEKGLVARPRNLLELAAALETSPEWIQHGTGVEIVQPKNPVEEIAALALGIPADRLGAAVQYLRTLRARADEEAA